jgi:hypothetical protein
VFVELGQTYPERDASLYARMLESNLLPLGGMSGRYGLHPHSRQAVYFMSLDMANVSGAQLAPILESQIALAVGAWNELAMEM